MSTLFFSGLKWIHSTQTLPAQNVTTEVNSHISGSIQTLEINASFQKNSCQPRTSFPHSTATKPMIKAHFSGQFFIINTTSLIRSRRVISMLCVRTLIKIISIVSYSPEEHAFIVFRSTKVSMVTISKRQQLHPPKIFTETLLLM